MIAALLTTLLFAGNAVFARRSALLLGGTRANAWRLLLATMLLGAWSLTLGRGLGLAFGWFFLSGLAGFGLGGLAMFHALPRAGSNLSMLIVQCGSALVAATLEWLWLGTSLTPAQLACAAAILVGVVLGLAPGGLPDIPRARLAAGAMLAALSAIGQGAGAVLSRKAFATAAALAGPCAIDPATSAYERALGGLVVAAAAWLVVASFRCRDAARASRTAGIAPAWPWVLTNTLAGPVLGVTCFQAALSTTPAGIVQPIVAAAPLLTVPLAWRFGETVPRTRYFAGAVLAVAATAALWLAR